jgi:GNAT superfamily N-acetyltransferase
MDDVARIEKLIARSLRELGPPHYTAAQVDSALAQVLGVDQQLIVDQTYFVIADRDDHAIIAAGGWSFRCKLFGRSVGASAPIPPRLNPAAAPAVIRAMFVHPQHARRGLGRRLLRASESAAKLAGFASAELVALLPALAFYRAHDYVVMDRREIDLPGGAALPALWMHKSRLE